MTPKYYESHVTIDPVFGDELEDVKHIASWHMFKVADLLMKKRQQDTPERSQFDTFCTGRGSDFDELKTRMELLHTQLVYCGYKVRRTKIEAVILDEKH